LADMNSLFWSTVANGGGDIRLYKADGTTELAREVVSCDTSGETGEVHVKYAGTLSSTVDTVIQVHADGTSSDYAAGATYGSEAVWTEYAGVWHLPNGTTLTANDSTSNGNDGTVNSASATAGVIGGGASFGASGNG